MYRQLKTPAGELVNTSICKTKTNSFIPFDPANTDYASFKKDVLEGAELQDADGNVMSAKKAKEFIQTLP